MPLALLVATVLRLSRLRMVAATWISNPLFAPLLVWSELQLGNLILTGEVMDHSLESVRENGVAALGQALAVGSLAIGVGLGFLAAFVVWKCIPRGPEETRRRAAIEKAAHRYLGLGLGRWFQIRNSLYGNRAIVDLVTSGRLVPGNRLVDLGCGRGELLALLVDGSPNGQLGSYVGVTSNQSRAEQARQVLSSPFIIEVGDPEMPDLESVDTVVVWRTKNRDAPSVNQRLIKMVRTSISRHGAFLLCWSDNDGSPEADRVVRWLESEKFVVEELSIQRGWIRRKNLILARA